MRKWAIGLGLLGFATLLVAGRHSLPSVLALIDGGGAEIGATDPAERLARQIGSAEDAAQAKPKPLPRTPLSAVGEGRIAVRLAVWTFNAPDIVEPKRAEPAWRTSFGSERTVNQFASAAAGFDADLIAVTSVRSLKLLRKAFPARDYFVIASPQLRAAALARSDRPDAEVVPATALVIRRGGQIRARRRLQSVFALGGTYDDLSSVPEDLRMAGRKVALPFAVQLLIGRARSWLVIVPARRACQSDEVVCRTGSAVAEKLARWVKTTRGRSETILIAQEGGGQTEGDPSDELHGAKAVIPKTTDPGCRRPQLKLSVLAAAKEPDASRPFAQPTDRLFRRRKGGGDCILLTQFAIEPAAPREPMFADDSLLFDRAPDVDTARPATAE